MGKIVTIPRELSREKELVIIPRRMYESLLENQKVTEQDVLRWTREAKDLKSRGVLPKLKLW
ncbi:MAG: hypothetical protein HY445_01640 [Candidatus Niyogibacteria bacterium]|nr:hypothetical protein [Candidatus Niyogibacteria bacterium]